MLKVIRPGNPKRQVTSRLALFCNPADNAVVTSMCADLFAADTGLVLFGSGVPEGAQAAQERLQTLLLEQAVRTDFALLFTRDELRLCDLSARDALGSGSVALVVTELTRRVGARTELHRACLSGVSTPSVLDPYAGWGMDALALVGEGAEVECVEQQPAMVALLRDAQRRVPTHLAARLKVTCGDALDVLRSTGQEGGAYDVVYLDPMFAPRKKGALPNKRLQFLAQLCASEAPTTKQLGDLVALACKKARKHVVLKRRKRDPQLPGMTPARQVVGTSVRYDVFLPTGA